MPASVNRIRKKGKARQAHLGLGEPITANTGHCTAHRTGCRPRVLPTGGAPSAGHCQAHHGPPRTAGRCLCAASAPGRGLRTASAPAASRAAGAGSALAMRAAASDILDVLINGV